MAMKHTILMILPEGSLADEFCVRLSPDHEILRATSEEEGLRLLNEWRFRIAAILLDLDMEKKSGYAFLRTVNGNILYAAIPVIAVLPRPPRPEDTDCLGQGAADILSPPCPSSLLTKRISNVIRAKDSVTFSEIERMLQALPSNIYLKDAEGKYVFATHYWHHLDMGNDPNWTIRGKTDPEIRKDRENAMLALESDRRILATGEGTRYIIEINEDGQQEFLELIKEPVRDGSGEITGIIGLINNVTEQQLLKRNLEKRSRTDELTGLYNRHHFEDCIKRLHTQKEFPVSFISADCNGLKQINDTYGHLVGDEYIRMSALLFKMVLPETALIFRVGGDEFAIILLRTSALEAQALISEMKQKASLFQIRNQQLSVAFGLSSINADTDDLIACIEEADRDMYTDKRKSKQARQ